VHVNRIYRDLLAESRNLLRTKDTRPRKRLGQNFVINSGIIEKLIDYAEVKPTEVVLEIGSGLGYLTEALTYKARRVIAVEIDRRLVEILEDRLQDKNNVEIISGDILSIELPKFDKVVSAPPYKISSPLIFRILEQQFKTAVLILQKEFAARLQASPGEKEYSRLSVMTQLRAQVEILDSVPPKAFYPEPEVNSSIVRLYPKPKNMEITDHEVFELLVRDLFGQRKRMLRKAIFPFLKYRMRLEEDQIDEFRRELPMSDCRVFALSPEDFVTLSNLVNEKISATRNKLS